MAACPQDQLNRIWRLYAAQGIGDDMQIIESIAYELLRRADFGTEVEDRNYPRPVALNPSRSADLEILLNESLSGITPSALLNDCLFFRLGGMQAGGRYPTPRHITRLMADLARIFVAGDEIAVADLACGSGGLLAEFGNCHVTGVEISPNWARLARANLLLYEMSSTIRTGDVLNEVGYLDANRFDIIAMNPPFGSPLEATLVDQRLGSGVGTRSETVLALLALESLSDDGVLAVLQPGGALFSTSSGEVALRERLLNENQLEAVIQLPKDAFQPYSQLQTYLLLARNAPQSSLAAGAPVWFYHISHDGFSSGRNRQPQPERSQLPQLVAAVAAGTVTDVWHIADGDGHPQLEITPLNGGGYRLVQPGGGRLTVKCMSGEESPAIWITRQAEETSQGLIHAGELWKQSAAIEVDSEVALQPRRFQIGDDSNQRVEFLQKGEEWQFHLKSTHRITPARSLAQDTGYLALVVFKEGDILSPLCLLEEVHRDYKPSPLTVLPLETEEGVLVGQLLLWDCEKLKPLYFASEEVGRGWVLIADNETAVLLGWEEGILRRALAGPLTSAFSGEPWHRGVVVDATGVRFGVAVAPNFIQDERQLDLTFERYYLPEEEDTAVDQSAAEILANLRRRQGDFSDRLDYLLGIVEMRPTPSLLSPLVDVAPLWPLNQKQQLVWQRIAGQVEESNGVTSARLFRPEQLGTGLDSGDVQNALVLFEKMGLIVAVAVNGASFYRRLTERDVVRL